jgi:hypothetical protein
VKIRLLLAVIFLLALPMWFSTTKGVNTNSAPFVSIAIAGHTATGNYCECGAPGCYCDPGEEETGHAVKPVKDAPPDKNPNPKPVRFYELDFGTAGFLLGLALFMWSRFRG